MQVIREMISDSVMQESPRSPEANVTMRAKDSSRDTRLGMKVEDLWDVQAPQLSPTEKLNACFENIHVSAFPAAPSSQVIEIRSDASIAEAVKILAEHKILSAPVVNVDAPEDASWMDRYIGIVEFAGIVVWILQQTEPPSPRSPHSGAALAVAINGLTNAAGLGYLGPEEATATSGNFFEDLTSSEFYINTKVQDIAGSFRWAPFLALQKENSFLTMLLLLSNYKMKSIPVVDLGERKIDSIITQASVIHMLAECAGLHWFENWGTKTLSEIGLPIMSPNHVIKVYEEDPVLQVFKQMRRKRIGAIPVVDSSGIKAVGNISLRDAHFLLTAPEIYHDFRSITAKNFLTAVRSHLNKHAEDSPLVSGLVTCRRGSTIKEVIQRLDTGKIHRIYVVDEAGNMEGVITLRDIISRLVHEPRGYFGDFFDGVLPLPENSRV